MSYFCRENVGSWYQGGPRHSMAVIIYIFQATSFFFPKGQTVLKKSCPPVTSLTPSTTLLFRQGSFFFFSLCVICAPLPPASHTPTRPSTKQGNTNRPLSGHIFLKTAGDGGSRWRSAFVNKSFTRPSERGWGRGGQRGRW